MIQFYFLNEHLLQSMGWTLIHSLWQITLMGLVIRFGRWLFKKSSPTAHYNLLLAGIVCILLTTGFTFYMLYQQPLTTYDSNAKSTQFVLAEPVQLLPSSETQIIAYDQSIIRTISKIIHTNIQLISFFWLIGFIIFSIRFAGGYWYLSRLKRKETRPITDRIQRLSDEIRKRLELRKYVSIFESISVKVPIAMGYFKPMIILPAGLVTSIPFNQLEAIITHELAHIKRNDFMVNLVKSLLEAIFFYHPVFWWISRQIENEREHCCDDLTITICKNDISFREALLNIQLHNQKLQHIAAALYKNKFQLLNRIQRMKTKNHSNHENHKSIAGLLILPALVIIFALSSAFAPRLNDLPDITIRNIPAVPINSEISNEFPIAEKSVEMIPSENVIVETPVHIAAEPELKPDTTKVKYGNKIKTDDGYILMEYDENMNLQQITKNGEELIGEEREKYEKFAEKSKKVYEADIHSKERTVELAKLEKQLQEVEEKMVKVKEEYSEIMKIYMEKAYADVNFEWPDMRVEAFEKDWQAQIEAIKNLQYEFPEFEDFPMPEVPEFNFNEDAFREQFERSRDIYEDVMRDYEHNRDNWVEENQFEEEQLALEKEARALEMESQQLETVLRNELLNDNLIDRWGDLKTFILSEKKMEVNGEKQPQKMHEKYLKLYKKLTGKELEGQIEINKD